MLRKRKSKPRRKREKVTVVRARVRVPVSAATAGALRTAVATTGDADDDDVVPVGFSVDASGDFIRLDYDLLNLATAKRFEEMFRLSARLRVEFVGHEDLSRRNAKLLAAALVEQFSEPE